MKILCIIYLCVFPILCDETIIKFGTLNQLNSFPIYDGIGGISGGGATSKLLVSYAARVYGQIYDYLFKPQFGASLPMLKVEIGGDVQSTEGTEASHSHYEGDLNCFRGYEWDIIKEAKKRNPHILLYGLPWGFPSWVGEHSRNPFKNATKCAAYVIDWMKCARDKHGAFVDFIGIWNEKTYTTEYIKTLRRQLDLNGFNKTRIIAADIKWRVAADIIKDSELRKAVYGIGCHYPGTVSSSQAKLSGLPLWSSEDYSTLNTEKGPGCWTRILNQNFVNGNMTSTISWNLIAAYYDSLPYTGSGLMTANTPWAGDNYRVTDTIWVTAHTTQFSTISQSRYVPVSVGGSGHLAGGGSFVSLLNNATLDLTMIIETMEHDFSVCIRPGLPPYQVVDQNVTIMVPALVLNKFKKFYIWRTILSSSKDSDKFKLEGVFHPDSEGRINVTMPRNNLVTVTTISTGHKGHYNHTEKVVDFPMEFKDDYESYKLAREPWYLVPQYGSFEVVQLPDAGRANKTNNVLLQTVIDSPIAWCFNGEIETLPIALIGSFSRPNVYVSVMGMLRGGTNSAQSLMLCGRVNNSGCTTFLAGGVFYWLNISSSEMAVSTDIYQSNQIYQAKVKPLKFGSWYTLAMILKENTGLFYLDNELVGQVDNVYSVAPPNGFAGLGVAEFGLAHFDNFTLKYI